MRVWAFGIALALLVATPFALAQQSRLPANSLQMSADHALVWSNQDTSIVEFPGPVSIELDRTRLSADRAVVWFSPAPGGLLDEQRVDIALIGNARLQQGDILRVDRRLLVTAVVSGSIRLLGDRVARQDNSSDLYLQALAMRDGNGAPPPTTAATTQPTTATAPSAIPSSGPMPVAIPLRQWSDSVPRNEALPLPPLTLHPTRFVDFDIDVDKTEFDQNGNIAAVLTRGVTLRYGDSAGNLLEFMGDRAVLFTDLKSTRGVGQGQDLKRLIAEHVQSVYFEGDVRVYTTPADQARSELRMEADRVYYELATDRAVMTNVVLHTVDLQKSIPVFIRAKLMRQLSQNEFRLHDTVLTTSSFATPSYSMGASEAYVRIEPSGDPELGDRVTFTARNALFDAFGVPFFYLPVAGGTMTSRGTPLRTINLSTDSTFGYGLRTEWGLFESLGQLPPKDLDVSYKLDYLGNRGPAGGLDATYDGGFVDETTKQPFSFLGDLHSYFVYDRGEDILGGARPDELPPQQFRGRAYLEHQVFFPDDWQVQLRLGWDSDANFLQQWFPNEFFNNLPLDESLYLKRQQDSEVFTLLAQWQPNDVVTTSDNVPNQREVEHFPEIGYYRVGDSLADDNLTFFSENTFDGLQFSHSGQSLAQQGFSPGLSPGLPSVAYTGDPGDLTWRGDLRQEIDWPINAGPFKVVPYAFGRYTVYSQGVDPPNPAPQQKSIPTTFTPGGDQNRLMGGAGLRLTTTFWKVDDSAESDFLDIHRLRHIVEPEIDLFTSAATIDQSHLFIYDPQVDAANAIQSVELALRQRWQTKRGGPGRWRSVDVFAWNIYADLFANQPDARFLDPTDFRGMFFSSTPEASVPRNSINSDAQWRLSDTTAVLADMSENLDRSKLATASIGMAIQRDTRLSYFLGVRYVADLDSTFASFDAHYDMTRKYALDFSNTIDLGQNKGIAYYFSITRKFDRFAMLVRAYYDQTANVKGITFTLIPFGLGHTLGTDQLSQLNPQ